MRLVTPKLFLMGIEAKRNFLRPLSKNTAFAGEVQAKTTDFSKFRIKNHKP